MTPIVNGLEAELAGQITVVRLNAAEPDNDAMMRRLDLRGHPAFVILDGEGQPRQTYLGPQTEETLRQGLAPLLTP